MKYIYSGFSILLLIPQIAFSAAVIEDYIFEIIDFINVTIIPVILALAFLFFIWNAAQFFIFQSASEEGREKAKKLALYGIMAFVIIISFWGIINVFAGALNLEGEPALNSDYIL